MRGESIAEKIKRLDEAITRQYKENGTVVKPILEDNDVDAAAVVATPKAVKTRTNTKATKRRRESVVTDDVDVGTQHGDYEGDEMPMPVTQAADDDIEAEMLPIKVPRRGGQKRKVAFQDGGNGDAQHEGRQASRAEQQTQQEEEEEDQDVIDERRRAEVEKNATRKIMTYLDMTVRIF